MTDRPTLTTEQAWQNIGGPNPVCDACRCPVFRELDTPKNTRAYQISQLAQRGIAHVLCTDCADPGPDSRGWQKWDREQLVNFVEACVMRVEVQK